MPLFNWPEKSSCGDTPPEQCLPLDIRETVKCLRASDVDTSCQVDLVAEQHPSIPVILSDMETHARSGSPSSPIPLNLLQEYGGAGPVPSILYKNLAGELHAWKPPIGCDGKKVVVEGGNFHIIDDVNSNVFEESCIGSSSDADYIAGAKQFIDCNGVVKIKLVFFPKAQLPPYIS